MLREGISERAATNPTGNPVKTGDGPAAVTGEKASVTVPSGYGKADAKHQA